MNYLIILASSYISSIKHEEDYEEFMENIVQRQNSAHIHAYNAIKYILFGNKLKKKETVQQQILPNNVSKSQLAEPRKDNQAGNYGKKGKKKFRDIKDFQEKKKKKQVLLLLYSV